MNCLKCGEKIEPTKPSTKQIGTGNRIAGAWCKNCKSAWRVKKPPREEWIVTKRIQV